MVNDQEPKPTKKAYPPKEFVANTAVAKHYFEKSLAVAGIGCAWVWLATANIGNCQLKSPKLVADIAERCFLGARSAGFSHHDKPNVVENASEDRNTLS